MKVVNISDYGAAEGGIMLCTEAIQLAIDEAAHCRGQVYIPKGVYLTGALFLKSNMCLYLEKGAILMGTTDEKAYPILETRVAGIEMEWPSAVINIRDASGVTIQGEGTIDGQGEFWWNKYWGEDRKGGMRAQHEKLGLRWAVDYDCYRVRNVVVYRSNDVTLKDFTSKRSGFWNIHICYCDDVTVDGITISDNLGPSTDGIDIDSCNKVTVENCTISCNDDNICVKSGRDADGLRVNKICENVMIRNNRILQGYGITLGSETSGGIRNITITDNQFYESTCGFRIKSAKTRGGVIENITVNELEMRNVQYPFTFQFNWNPSYSYCKLPDHYQGEQPDYWKILTLNVSPEVLPIARKIYISNVKAYFKQDSEMDIAITDTREREEIPFSTKDYQAGSVAFDIQGIEEAPFNDFTFENIEIQAKDFGTITNINNLFLKNVKVDIIDN